MFFVLSYVVPPAGGVMQCCGFSNAGEGDKAE